jgi:Rrf2 family protein
MFLTGFAHNHQMISQTAEYALRAIVYLADQDGSPRTTAQIAGATQVPPGYLAKVMQSLGRARLVNSQRGINGGFSLCATPNQLSVLEVINAVDPIRRYDSCPLGLHGVDLCQLHRRLDDVTQMAEQVLGETSIADLLNAPPRETSLCRFPDSPDGSS